MEALLDCNFVLAAKIGSGASYELREHGIASFEMPGEVGQSLYRLDGYIKLLEEMNGLLA